MKTKTRKPDLKVEGPRRAQITAKGKDQTPHLYPTVNLRRLKHAAQVARQKVAAVGRRPPTLQEQQLGQAIRQLEYGRRKREREQLEKLWRERNAMVRSMIEQGVAPEAAKERVDDLLDTAQLDERLASDARDVAGQTRELTDRRQQEFERLQAETKGRFSRAYVRGITDRLGITERDELTPRSPIDQSTESRHMKVLLTRVAGVLEARGRTFGRGGHISKREWVEQTAANPWKTASILQGFGQAAGAPIFQEVAYEIIGRPVQPYKDKDGKIRYRSAPQTDPRDPGVGRVGVRDPDYQRQEFIDDQTALDTLTPEERMLLLQGDLKARDDVERAMTQLGEDIDTTGNAVMALAMVTPARGLTGALGQVGQWAPGLSYALGGQELLLQPGERWRPGVGRHWRMIDPSMDMIEARDKTGRLVTQLEELVAKDADEEEIKAVQAQLRESNKEFKVAQLAFQTAAKETEYHQNPYSNKDRAADHMAEDMWLTFQGLANQNFNYALSPTMTPVARVGLRYLMGDPQADNPQFWENASARERARFRSSRAVRARLLAETEWAQMSDPDIIGDRLMTDYYGFKAGTKITPQMMKQIRDKAPSVQTIPVMSNSMWDHLKIEGPDVAEGVGLMTAGYWARMKIVEGLAEVSGNLHRYSRLAKSGSRAAKWAGRLAKMGNKVAHSLSAGNRFTHWVSNNKIGRFFKRGLLSRSARAALGGADEAAAIMAAGRSQVAGALFRAASRGKAGARVASQLGRAGRWARGASKALKLLRPLGVIGTVVAGAQGWRDAWYYSFTDEGQEALDEAMRQQVLDKIDDPDKALLRDLVSIPEAYFWDQEHARAALAINLSRRFNDDWRQTEHELAQGYIRDKRTAAEVDRAMQDLTRALPGMDELQLYGAAQSLAANRIGTRYQDPHFSGRRQVSRFEYEISQSPLYQAMTPAAKKRTSDLIRLAGPTAFREVFFVSDPRTGEQVVNRTAWQSLLKGVDRELPNRLGWDGDLTLHYRNKYERSKQEIQFEQANRERRALEMKTRLETEQKERMAQLDASAAARREQFDAQQAEFYKKQEEWKARQRQQFEQEMELKRKDHDAFLRMIDRSRQADDELYPRFRQEEPQASVRQAIEDETADADFWADEPPTLGSGLSRWYQRQLAGLDGALARPPQPMQPAAQTPITQPPADPARAQFLARLDQPWASAENPPSGAS